MNIIWEREKQNLKETIEVIENLECRLADLADEYGHYVEAMVVEHEEIKHNKIDTVSLDNKLCRLRELIEQFIKEKDESSG